MKYEDLRYYAFSYYIYIDENNFTLDGRNTMYSEK